MTNVRARLALCGLPAILLAAAGLVVSAQAPAPRQDASAASVASYALSQQMPVDPEVVVGTLPNGLRYYVRANKRPEHRAELRLVVKAGSVLEDDDQQGVAHFDEHMEFEGTEHFPKQSILSFLSSLGMSLGPDANAQTSYDDTQYTLRVPTDVPGVLDRALLILDDWSHSATFDQSGIDYERGIVLSEWRMHLGAGERTVDKILQMQLKGSRYAERIPIGKPEIIEKARREQLTRFYHDWYRPDLMAVIAVGDFDRDAVAGMIKAHFSSLSSPSPERPRPAYDVPDHAGARYAIITDRETTTTTIAISDLLPGRNQSSVGGYRDQIRDQLFAGMLNGRLGELSQGANAPFIRAAADRTLFATPRTKDEAVLQALVPNDGVERGLDALLSEIERVSRFGFTATELEREKQAMMLGYERAVTESPDRESESRADEYTRNFLEGEALPTIWQELAFHRRFVPGITLSDVNALAAEWFADRNRLVVVSAPDAAGVSVPDETKLAAVIKAASAKPLQPYVDTVGTRPLMETPPTPGNIVKTTVRADVGITEWQLSNGATVILKPTALKEDEILFRATAPGGTSLASDADYIPARVADMVVPAGGVGQFSAVMLDKILSGKFAVVTPFLADTQEGMNGRSTPQDLETMCQLIYLRFTQPRADPTAFGVLSSQFKSLLANQMASPDVVFNQTIDAAVTQNHPRRQPETPATVDRWNLDTSMAFYKARFADAGNFTFVFVGSFTPDAMKPLVEKYIASLPATHARETWRDVGITPPSGIVQKRVEKGIAPKSEVAIVFSGPFQYDDAHRLALRAMALVLQSRLLDTIRQQLGGTYSITANQSIEKFPKPEYSLRIDWTCDPARTADLVQRVFQEIEYVKNTPLDRGQMAVVREVLLRQFEANSRENGYLLNQISQRYAEGDAAGLAAAVNLPGRLGTLTADDVQQTARTHLKSDNYVIVTLLPERK
ncbi:MAG TPA: insulinase family protein [Vicinamibacterales bacterium]|nr:insulinase family protein [Vicinamibacterales bacterium]